jgi:hypothetical protein
MNMIPFALRALPRAVTLGPAVMVGGLALAVLVGGQTPAAEASGNVDLKIAMSAKSTTVGAGQKAYINALVGHDGPATSAAKVEILLSKQYTNLQVVNATGFSCNTSSTTFFNSPAWKVSCTKSAIAPNDQWFDAVQLSANAPSTPGSYGVLGSITPTNATETDSSDNSGIVYIQVS